MTNIPKYGKVKIILRWKESSRIRNHQMHLDLYMIRDKSVLYLPFGTMHSVILDYTRRAGGPKDLLWRGWNKYQRDPKKFTFSELFWTRLYRFSIPELAKFRIKNGSPGHLEKSILRTVENENRSKTTLRGVYAGHTPPYIHHTHHEHGFFESLYTIGPSGNYM